MREYLIDGRRRQNDEVGWNALLAHCHAHRWRPKCLCVPPGLEMYVARVGKEFIVKRMPRTGWLHAPTCDSFEPADELTGHGALPQSALTENTSTGLTTIRLGFPLSIGMSRHVRCSQTPRDDAAQSDEGRLSLRSLLLYLWERSELTRWMPAFAQRRSWATVRRLLYRAAETTVCGGRPLSDRIYIPEMFSTALKGDIEARRQSQWERMAAHARTARPYLILIAELKTLEASRAGARAVFKHLPQVPFALDDKLYRRVERHLESELALWGTAEDLHFVTIATFVPTSAGVARLNDVAATVVSPQWLPVETLAELRLVRQLVREDRRFVKGLRYDCSSELPVAIVTMTDCGPDRGHIAASQCAHAALGAFEPMTKTADATAQPPWATAVP